MLTRTAQRIGIASLFAIASNAAIVAGRPLIEPWLRDPEWRQARAPLFSENWTMQRSAVGRSIRVSLRSRDPHAPRSMLESAVPARWVTGERPWGRCGTGICGYYRIEQAGWPWPSFSGQRGSTPTLGQFSFNLRRYELPQTRYLPARWSRLNGQIEIPTTPIYPALAADLTVHAALWSAPLIGIPMLRSRHARRRSGCTSCGYDIRGIDVAQPCPECGTYHTE